MSKRKTDQDKIAEYLQDLIAKINEPLQDCPHCSLQIAERFASAFEAFEEFSLNPSTQTQNTLDELKIQWNNSLNL